MNMESCLPFVIVLPAFSSPFLRFSSLRRQQKKFLHLLPKKRRKNLLLLSLVVFRFLFLFFSFFPLPPFSPSPLLLLLFHTQPSKLQLVLSNSYVLGILFVSTIYHIDSTICDYMVPFLSSPLSFQLFTLSFSFSYR